MTTRTWTKNERYRRVVLAWSRVRPRRFPWRETLDPYEVLVGEVLLQRTRGENVAQPYAEFVRRWPDVESLARAEPSQVGDVIGPLGLAKRAEVLVSLGRALEEYPTVPLDPEVLQKLPGVGPYAAHAVPVFAAGRSLPLVDWVIARVLRRYFGLADERRPNADPALWELATALAGPGRAKELWLGTLDFATAVCKPKPRCRECRLRQTCSYITGEASV